MWQKEEGFSMKPLRKVILTLVIFVLVYSATGVAFHVAWKAERHACDALRRARGEFVESELFPILGVAFTMVWWPVYAWANVYHNNALFTTPCTNQAAPSPP